RHHDSVCRIRALPTPPPFPYTTLFRSQPVGGHRLDGPLDRAELIGHVFVEDARALFQVLRRTDERVDVLPRVEGPGRGHEHLRRSEEHTSELQSRVDLVCRLPLEKKKT